VEQALIATYLDLMTALHDLPGEIAETQALLTTVSINLAKSEQTIKDMKLAATATAEGSNDTKREAFANAKLAEDAVYQRWLRAAQSERSEAAKLTDELKDRERRYKSVCYQSDLHAAMLGYAAKAQALMAMAIPAIPVNGFNGTTYGVIDLTDAAMIGL
jgi:hypothetical protein